MDSTAVTGYAAAIAAIIIFCGSVGLLLAMVLGGRLAYFISASVTLAFLLIMGVVWGFTNPASPLGPVGELPSWNEEAIGPDVSEFGYPEGDWRVPNEDDDNDTLLKGGIEGDAADYLEKEIEANDAFGYGDISEAVVNSDATRLIEQDGTTYGGTVFEPIEGVEAETVTVIMSYDEGNPLSMGRYVTLGTLVLLVLHLIGLSRAERRAKNLPGAEVT
jgi:hypothetical protein